MKKIDFKKLAAPVGLVIGIVGLLLDKVSDNNKLEEMKTEIKNELKEELK